MKSKHKHDNRSKSEDEGLEHGLPHRYPENGAKKKHKRRTSKERLDHAHGGSFGGPQDLDEEKPDTD